jgi:hypothetical protein
MTPRRHEDRIKTINTNSPISFLKLVPIFYCYSLLLFSSCLASWRHGGSIVLVLLGVMASWRLIIVLDGLGGPGGSINDLNFLASWRLGG